MAHKYDGFARQFGFLNWRDAEVRVRKAKLWVATHKDQWPPPWNLRGAAELQYRVARYENAPWRVYGRAVQALWLWLRDRAALSPRFRYDFPWAYYDVDQMLDYLDRKTLPHQKASLAKAAPHDLDSIAVAHQKEYTLLFGLTDKRNPHRDPAALRVVNTLIRRSWLNWH